METWGQSSDFWKRIWIIVVWGQAAILALAAVVGATSIDPLRFYVVASILSFALIALALSPERLRQRLVQATALSIIAAAAANMMRNGLFPADAAATTVNALLILGSLWLLSRTRASVQRARA